MFEFFGSTLSYYESQIEKKSICVSFRARDQIWWRLNPYIIELSS